MQFKIATGFDRTLRDEEFTQVDLSEETVREIVMQHFLRKQDYAKNAGWIAERVRAGEASIVP